jgi:hypothetical protein
MIKIMNTSAASSTKETQSHCHETHSDDDDDDERIIINGKCISIETIME